MNTNKKGDIKYVSFQNSSIAFYVWFIQTVYQRSEIDGVQHLNPHFVKNTAFMESRIRIYCEYR